MKIGVGVRWQNEAAIRHPGKRCDSLLDFGRSIVDGGQHKFNAEGGGRRLRRTQIEFIVRGRLRIGHERSARGLARPPSTVASHLPVILNSKSKKPVILRPGRAETGDEARADRIGHAANTIGIMVVSRCNAAVAGDALLRITSGRSSTSSFANTSARAPAGAKR